jgi:hypothetical protein
VQLEAFKKQLMKSLSEDNLLVSCIDQLFLFTLSQKLLLPFKPSLLLELLCEQTILLACFSQQLSETSQDHNGEDILTARVPYWKGVVQHPYSFDSIFR